MPSAIVRGLVTEELKAGQFSLTRATYRAGSRLRRHEHPVASLQIVVRGAFVETVARRRLPLAAGWVVFKPKGALHADVYDEFVECLVVGVPDSIGCELQVAVADLTTRAWAVNLIRETHTRLPGWELVVEGLVFQALGHLTRIHELDRRRPSWLDDVTDLARQQRHLTEIAAAIGRHPSHVARAFRRHQGVSVGEYARRFRLERAAVALRATDESIAEIAMVAGFCDQSHFTNSFRRLFRVTPAEYWRQCR